MKVIIDIGILIRRTLMMDQTALLKIEKENLRSLSIMIDQEDIPQLVEWLNEKDNEIRYQALLLLQYRSQSVKDVYPFWDVFCDKLKSDNSYQRSIGLMLIAENTRWDKEGKTDKVIKDYMALLYDEKPITVRQCIQALSVIIANKPDLNHFIALTLISMDLTRVKETMRRLILTDLLYVLIDIRKNISEQVSTLLEGDILLQEIDSYISKALTGEILDKKSKKLIEAGI
jgi:hypothetical protein